MGIGGGGGALAPNAALSRPAKEWRLPSTREAHVRLEGSMWSRSARVRACEGAARRGASSAADALGSGPRVSGDRGAGVRRMCVPSPRMMRRAPHNGGHTQIAARSFRLLHWDRGVWGREATLKLSLWASAAARAGPPRGSWSSQWRLDLGWECANATAPRRFDNVPRTWHQVTSHSQHSVKRPYDTDKLMHEQ